MYFHVRLLDEIVFAIHIAIKKICYQGKDTYKTPYIHPIVKALVFFIIYNWMRQCVCLFYQLYIKLDRKLISNV